MKTWIDEDRVIHEMGPPAKPWDARVFFGAIGGFIIAAYIAGFIMKFFGIL
jgi:hypothetical protein